MTREQFIPPPQEACTKIGGRTTWITFGGPNLIMPLPNGREAVFEMHNWHGPIPRDKDADEAIDFNKVPAQFWNSFELWKLGGQIVDGNRCVVPELCERCKGLGVTVEMFSKRSGVVTGKCEACNGTKLKQKGTQ